jgi:hypothetical protein
MNRKKFLFYLVTLGFLFLLAEAVSYLSLRLLFRQRKIILREAPTPDVLDSFFRRSFDPDLGWDNRPGPDRPEIGPRTERRDETQTGLGPPEEGIAAFGDSFTFCSEVEDDETWPHYLSGLTGMRVANFGVIGYGTDQAYLKFRRETARRPVRIALLGINVENIGRIVNTYRGFYCCAGVFNQGFTKPRFVPAGTGLKLVLNPIRTREEFDRYMNEESLKTIPHERYSYKPLFQSPYIYAFYHSLPQLAEKTRRQIGILLDGTRKRTYPYHDLYRDEEAMAILKTLAAWFYNPAEAPDDGTVNGWFGHPFLERAGEGGSPTAVSSGYPERRAAVIFYGRWEFERFRLTGGYGNEPFVQFLKDRGWPFVDTKAALSSYLDENGWDQLDALFGPEGHHSPLANRIVAEQIARFLNSGS